MRGCRAITVRELEQIIEAQDSLYREPVALRNKTIFLLMATTGIRVGELCGLVVRDIAVGGLVQSHLKLPKRVTKGKLDGRIVKLNQKTRDQLQKYLEFAQLSPGGPLFRPIRQSFTPYPIWYDKPIYHSTVRQALKETVVYLDLPSNHLVSTHSFRKFFAHRVYEILDHDLLATQRALGHRQVAATVLYLSVKDGRVEEAIDEIV